MQTGPRVVASDGVTLALDTTTILLGRNGAGKTSTIRAMRSAKKTWFLPVTRVRLRHAALGWQPSMSFPFGSKMDVARVDRYRELLEAGAPTTDCFIELFGGPEAKGYPPRVLDLWHRRFEGVELKVESTYPFEEPRHRRMTTQVELVGGVFGRGEWTDVVRSLAGITSEEYREWLHDSAAQGDQEQRRPWEPWLQATLALGSSLWVGTPRPHMFPSIIDLDSDVGSLAEDVRDRINLSLEYFYGDSLTSYDFWAVTNDGLGAMPRDGIHTVVTRLNAILGEVGYPDFIRGQIQFRASTISDMLRGHPAIVVEYSASSNVIPLADIAGGEQRWLSVVVRLVLSRFEREPVVGFDRLAPGVSAIVERLRAEGNEVPDDYEKDFDYLDDLHSWEGLWDQSVPVWGRIDEGGMPVILLDEPELGLHPSALGGAHRWLESQVRSGVALVVATHNPKLMNVGGQLRTRLLLTRDNTGTVSSLDLDGPDGSSLHEVAEEVGVSGADLLQTTRLLLLVEGRHDEQVLDFFGSSLLDDAGVVVLPLHGTRNTANFAESEILARWGVPVAVLFDNTRTSVVRDMQTQEVTGMRFDEERKASAFVNRLLQRGHPVGAVPFDVPDVFCALRVDAVRAAYPHVAEFDWTDIIAAYRALPERTEFKRWLFHELGAPNAQADEWLTRVLDQSDASNPAPVMRRTLATIVAIADELDRRDHSLLVRDEVPE